MKQVNKNLDEIEKRNAEQRVYIDAGLVEEWVQSPEAKHREARLKKRNQERAKFDQTKQQIEEVNQNMANHFGVKPIYLFIKQSFHSSGSLLQRGEVRGVSVEIATGGRHSNGNYKYLKDGSINLEGLKNRLYKVYVDIKAKQDRENEKKKKQEEAKQIIPEGFEEQIKEAFQISDYNTITFTLNDSNKLIAFTTRPVHTPRRKGFQQSQNMIFDKPVTIEQAQEYIKLVKKHNQEREAFWNNVQ